MLILFDGIKAQYNNMMSEDNRKQMELQIHLAEFSALRDEILALIKWRDSLVFISLGISGALYSFVFSSSIVNQSGISAYRSALYIVTPLSTLVGGLWMVNTWRIYRIGNYIREVLAVQLNKIVNPQTGTMNSLKVDVFEWQSSKQRLDFKWQRRGIEWLIYVMTFVVSGVLAQILLLSTPEKSLTLEFGKLEYPSIFILNSLLILAVFSLFLIYLKKGRGQKMKGKVLFKNPNS